MLVLTRKQNQAVYVGSDIIIKVVEIRGDKVKLGFTAPRGVEIVRDDATVKEPRNEQA